MTTTTERDLAFLSVPNHKIAAAFYHNADIFNDELDWVFRKNWVYVGHDSEVSAPNSFCRKMVAGQELILTRDASGRVAVFFNRCTHRGNLLCLAEQGEARTFRCSYHGWTFGMNGGLVAVPRPDAYAERLGELKRDLGLSPVARLASYGGFVFAQIDDHDAAPTFDDYVEPIKPAIDRLLALSPEGRVELSAGWLGQTLHCNWKIAVEGNVDNYHVNFVHKSVMDAVTGSIDSDEDIVVRDLGMGHAEVDFTQQLRRKDGILNWTGGVAPAKLGDYVSRLQERLGKAEARQVLTDGPPHVMVYPNLFMSQMNLVVIDPVDVARSTAYTTPVQLAGAPELNRRTVQQSAAAMGPAGMIYADDAEVGERNQAALSTLKPRWLELTRGIERESVDGQGRRHSDFGGDETALRAIWNEYAARMNQSISDV